MSTKYIASNWRLPNQENSSKSDNYGLTFDGNEYISTGAAIELSTDRSISMWFKNPSISDLKRLAAFPMASPYNKTLTLGFYNSKLIASITTSFPTTVSYETSALSSDTWYHLVIKVVGTTVTLYINGVEDTTTPAGTNFGYGDLVGYIGAVTSSAAKYIGDISEVAVFDYALSESQISTLYGSSSLGAGNPMALKPQPVAYYPLGDNSASNPLTQPNEAVEDASVFDFSSDYIEILDNNNFDFGTNDFTISAWFKTSVTPSQHQTILSKQNPENSSEWVLQVLRSDNKLSFRTNGVDIVKSTTTVNDGNWNNVIITRVSGVFNLYLNSSQEDTTTSNQNLTNTENLRIGHRNSVYNAYFDGELSNIAIWNSDQSSEISNIYNSGVPATSYTNTPTAWYKLDQSANWEADSSGAWQIPDAVSAYPQSFEILSNDSIDFTNGLLSDLSAFTISFWYNRGAVNSTTATLLKQNGVITISQYRQSASYSGLQIVLTTVNGQSSILSTSQGNVPTGEWLHVGIVYDGSNMTLYRNGSQAAGTYNPVAATGNTVNNTNVFEIFAQTSLEYGISNLQVWDTNLSATGSNSIETLYNNGSPLTTAIASDNLKLWAKLDNNEKFDGTNWEVENQKYPANYETALSFDGSNDYIDTGAASFSGLTEMSVSAWVKPTATGTGAAEAILSTEAASPNRGFYLSLFVGSNYRWQVSTDGSNKDSLDAGVIVLNEWTHIAATWNQSTMNLYVNGSLAGTMSTVNATGTFSTTNNMFIGQRTSGAGYFPGDISNVAFYNTVLDSSAVQALYNNGTPETSISSSPVSWWKLNNLTTGIQDSVGSNNGTNNGATKVNTFVSTEAATSSGMTEQNLVNNNVSALNGESSGMTSASLVLSDLSRSLPYGDGYSFNFDSASSDYIDCGNDTSLNWGTGNGSVSCWFKTTQNVVSVADLVINGGFSTGGKAYILYLDSSEKVGFALDDNSSPTTPAQSSGSVADGNWHHVVGVRESGNIKLYLDGSLVSTQTDTTGNIDSTDPLIIGAGMNASTGVVGNFYDGKISNVSIFNEALTPTEVQKLYANGVPQDLTNFNLQPQAWWPLGSNSFWNGSAWTVRDMSTGGSNDGTGQNIGIDGLVGDSPRSSANGVGTNNSIPENLVGTTKWSENNSWSINMSETARVEDTP